MNIRIGHCKKGILFDGDVAKLEIIEQDEVIRYIIHGWDGEEHDILAENKYSVLRIGNKHDSSRPTGWLSENGKPTTFDIAMHFENARAKLIDMGVDIDQISFYLPGENGMKMFGPMPLDEAQSICYDYWSSYKPYWDKEKAGD